MINSIEPGQLVQVSDRVRRITAPNPGPMTGSGTNTYLVGQQSVAVIDPGPAEPSHIDAILQACGDQLRWILATHTHPDHSPAAVALAEATGAVIMGNTLGENDGFQDESFKPQKSFQHDESWLTEEFSLRALHTPGHVNNHLCFLVEEDGLLLTGDHIMQGSTVVIIPPHGDMQDYIESLRLLLPYPVKALGPGHGTIIEKPIEEIQGIINHRLGREIKVVTVMSDRQTGTLETLTPLVYDDVDAALHPVASYSLHAHLIKLLKEQRVKLQGDTWHWL
ncbi:MAG: MBL fold metallo-hydrolase [Oceanicoccus sp.]|uniref:MBL fold metallo-hydrolase n=1 Tax=Oceanicoccus sp. TaxID=2691044 RepID=UPI00261797D4|nr:MBL fold metallo-hydrolase [Oceanicoccus sp.]MDG1772519.1 MBL fold metallo-hydrolase [Oceanicoccus sp.]